MNTGQTLTLLLAMLTASAIAQDNRVLPYDVKLQHEITLTNATFQLDRPARFSLPALPAKPGLIPVLRARIFVECPTPGGFNMNARILVNGTPLQRKTVKNQERLLLRPTTFTLLWQGSAYHGQRYNVFAGDTPAIMFAPDAKTADSMTDDGLGGTFLFDLSDVTRGVDLNTIEVVGASSIEYAKRADGSQGEGHIQDIAVGYLDRSVLPSTVKTPPKRELPPPKRDSRKASFTLTKGGGFVFEYGGRQLCVETGLGMDANAPSELIVADRPAAVMKTRTRAEWPSGLRMDRTLRLRGHDALSWKETWTNTSTNDLAVPFQYHLFLNNQPAAILIGGNPDADFLATSPANPTVFLADEPAGIGFGWVAESDWLRLLMQLSRDGAGARVLSRNLALPPGKSITFDMTLQAQPSASYWDFINAVRARWNVNHVRIDGPINWNVKLPDKPGDAGWDGRAETRVAYAVTNRGPLVAIITPWILADDITAGIILAQKYGTNILSDEVVREFYAGPHHAGLYQDFKRQADAIRQADPRGRVMGMMHPAMHAAYKPKLALYPFFDECILTRAGQPFEDAGYSRAWFGDMVNRGWGVLYIAPHAGGKYQHHLLNRLRAAFDVAGLDGIYCDEFTFVTGQRGYSRYDYRQWDGYTVLLNEDGTIAAKATDNAMVSEPLQLALIDEARRRHKLMLVNCAPALRATQNTGISHFVEGGNGYWAGAETHLSTPLVFGNVGQPQNQADLMKLSRRLLETGCLHVPLGANLMFQGENNFITKQHPITPQRLGPGFVIGRERIVTGKSGEFAWPPKPGMVRVYRYDANGNLLPDSPESRRVRSPIRLEAPADGLVIAETEK